MASQESYFPYTLYVGDLDATVTESDLKISFIASGLKPDSAHVCRDRFTRRSLCYAYLNFSSYEIAEKAMREMNHKFLKGKQMRIMWPLRDVRFRRMEAANLFVKNLAQIVGASELETVFSQFGAVISCKVVFDENGYSKQFGFVQMDSVPSATAAIVALNGKAIPVFSNDLYVAKFRSKCQRQTLPNKRKYTNLYVKNLGLDVTDDVLRSRFSEFGKVFSAVVMKNEAGESKGFGFVCFESFEQATKAMRTLDSSLLGSNTIIVRYAQKKAEREVLLKLRFNEKIKGMNVFVSNLDRAVNDKQLTELFSKCGQVKVAKVITNHYSGLSKGYGFVGFSDPEEAKNAVNTLHGTLYQGKELSVAVAQCREDRRKGLVRENISSASSSSSSSSSAPSSSLHASALPYYQHPNVQVPYNGQQMYGYMPPAPFYPQYPQYNYFQYPKYSQFQLKDLGKLNQGIVIDPCR